MRIRKAGHILIFQRKFRKIFKHLRALFQHQLRRFFQDDDVGIVPDVAARRAEVNDTRGFGALQPVGVNVAHHVVAHHLFPRFGNLVIDVVLMRFELRYLLVGNVEPQLFFRFCQRDPEFSPRSEFETFGKDLLHLFRSVPRGKRADIIGFRNFHGVFPICFY